MSRYDSFKPVLWEITDMVDVLCASGRECVVSWRGHVAHLVECVSTLQGSDLIKLFWYYIQYFLVSSW